MTYKSTIVKRLIHGGIWATVGRLLFALGTLAWNALLTRLLTESEAGAFYIIASIVVVGEIFVLGGMNQAVMRLISANTEHIYPIRPVVKGSIIMVAMYALVSGALYVLVIGPHLGHKLFHSELISDLVILTAAWFILRASQNFLAFFLRGFHRVSIAAFVDGTFTSYFISFALIILWFFSGKANIQEILFIVIGALSSTVAFSLFLVRKSYSHTPKTSGIMLGEPMRIGIPLWILAISVVGFRETHIWIAGSLTEHSDVALYGAATRVSNFALLPLLVINGVIPSSISQLYAKNDNNRIQIILQSAAVITAIPIFIIAMIVTIESSEILTLLFGQNYSAGWSVLSILIIGQAFSVFFGSPNIMLAMANRQTISMVIGIISGAVGILISLIAVKPYGIVGIAIGLVSGRIICNFTMWLYCLYALQIRTHASIYSIKHIKNILKNSNIF